MYGKNGNKYAVPPPPFLRGLIEAHPEVALFVEKHPARSWVHEEWAATEQRRMENSGGLTYFAELVQAAYGTAALQMPLWATGVFVRKVHNAPDISKAFEATFDIMIEYGINRDQNVASFMQFEYAKPNASTRILCGMFRGKPLTAAPHFPHRHRLGGLSDATKFRWQLAHKSPSPGISEQMLGFA